MDVNARQRQLFVQKVVAQFGENLSDKTFAVWGLAFKPDTDDIREAPALDIIRELHGRGARIQAYDPEAVDNTKRLLPDITYCASALEALNDADALLITTEWKEFLAIEPDVLAKCLKSKIVFDGRNIFEPHTMQRAGLIYFSVGRAASHA